MMTTEILGPTVHYDVCAQRKRILETWRAERRVNYQVCSAFVSLVCKPSDTECFSCWVNWRFEVDYVAFFESVELVESQNFTSRQLLVQSGYLATAVVPVADGYVLRFEKYEVCIHRGQTGGVGSCWAADECG